MLKEFCRGLYNVNGFFKVDICFLLILDFKILEIIFCIKVCTLKLYVSFILSLELVVVVNLEYLKIREMGLKPNIF